METRGKTTLRGTGAVMKWRRPVTQTLCPPATTAVRSVSAALLSKCSALRREITRLLMTVLITADSCCLLNRGKIFSLWESGREGLHRAAAGRWTFRLQRGFSDRRPSGLRVWQVKMIKCTSDCALLGRSQTHLYCFTTFPFVSCCYSNVSLSKLSPVTAEFLSPHEVKCFYSFSRAHEWFSSSGSGAALFSM